MISLIRKYGSTVLGCIGVALWIAALFLLAAVAQNSAKFDEWLPWILLINISGLLTLFALLVGKLARDDGLEAAAAEVDGLLGRARVEDRDHGILRRLAVQARVDPPPIARAALRGLRHGTLGFTVGFSGVNQPVSIQAPPHALPLSALIKVLQQIGVGGGSTSSTTSSTATSSTATSSTPTLPAGAAPPAYLRCYEQAGSDLVARAKCAPLLNGH